MKQKDLSNGFDSRGDTALFIEQKHFKGKGSWDLDAKVKRHLDSRKETDLFFRVIIDGEEVSSHGWISVREKCVMQWG